MAYAAIRVRGHSGVRHDVEDTMRMLRLTRANHCVILPETEEIKGMLMKAKDYITEGDVMQVVLSQRMTKPFHASPMAAATRSPRWAGTRFIRAATVVRYILFGVMCRMAATSILCTVFTSNRLMHATARVRRTTADASAQPLRVIIFLRRSFTPKKAQTMVWPSTATSFTGNRD